VPRRAPRGFAAALLMAADYIVRELKLWELEASANARPPGQFQSCRADALQRRQYTAARRIIHMSPLTNAGVAESAGATPKTALLHPHRRPWSCHFQAFPPAVINQHL
jgi:hypothetical protein